MLKSIASKWYYPILIGALPALIWPPSGFSFLLIVAFVPMLLNIRSGWSMKTVALRIYLYFITFNLITLRWVWTIDFGAKGWFLAIMSFLILPLFQGMPLWCAVWLRHRTDRLESLFAWPLLAVVVELMNNAWFLGFPWLNFSLGLGSSIIEPNGLAVTGIVGGTAVLVSINVLFVLVFHVGMKSRASKVYTSISLVLLGLLFFPKPEAEGIPLEIAIVEPETDPYKSDDSQLFEHSRHVIESIRIASKRGVKLVVFPEGYFRYSSEHPLFVNDLSLNPAIRDIQRECEESGTSILFGAIAKRIYEEDVAPTITAKKEREGLYSDLMNIAILIDDNGGIDYRAKSRLVPFMERAPFIEWSSKFEWFRVNMNQASGSYLADSAMRVFEWKGIEILPLICYETFSLNEFTADVKSFDLVITISNEAWPKSGLMTRQHESYDQCVSALFDVPIVRCNTRFRGFNSGENRVGDQVNTSFGSIIFETFSLKKE